VISAAPVVLPRAFFAARGPWASAGARPSLRPHFGGRHAAAQLGRHTPRDHGRMPAGCL